jgi:hypothetical protein
MLRFRAVLVLDAHSLKRNAELGTTLTDGVVGFPDISGLIVNYTWGKTLRSSNSHIFGVFAQAARPRHVPCRVRRRVRGGRRSTWLPLNMSRLLSCQYLEARGAPRHPNGPGAYGNGPAFRVDSVWDLLR